MFSNKTIFMQDKIVAWRKPDRDVSIAVHHWLYIVPIKDQFIEYPRNVWLIWNYLQRIGVKAVLHKLRSRLTERKRNRKASGLGVGTVIAAPDASGVSQGTKVIFFASNHNPDWPVVVVHQAFVLPVPEVEHNWSGHLYEHTLPTTLTSYAGWSAYAGEPLDAESIKTALEACLSQGWLKAKPLLKHTPQEQMIQRQDQWEVVPLPTTKPRVVLFGLGNYAKTAILPNIRPYLALERVHEIDVDQLAFFGNNPQLSLDTSPLPRENLHFDVWFIAGYHHTHTDLAIRALKQSAVAVIEKPLATNVLQHRQFLQTLVEQPDARFFVCFHKRYSMLHELATIDLKAKQPIDMHCIVYEIPLPSRHWYNWPNSGSRLISNGCHWIDYFLFINDYTEVRDYHVWRPRGSDVCVQVRLKTGAYFSMTLTDNGSQRLGVRDYIELRQEFVTVKMIDGSFYESENRQRVIRKVRVNPLHAYARMYQRIAQSIVMNQLGDPQASLLSSWLTLELEAATSNLGQ